MHFLHLENFKQTYTNSAIAHKKKLISSIFPEKIEFGFFYGNNKFDRKKMSTQIA